MTEDPRSGGPPAAAPTAQVEAAARALWKIGNARIGERPWEAVCAHYIAEAAVALEAAGALSGVAPPTYPGVPTDAELLSLGECAVKGYLDFPAARSWFSNWLVVAAGRGSAPKEDKP